MPIVPLELVSNLVPNLKLMTNLFALKVGVFCSLSNLAKIGAKKRRRTVQAHKICIAAFDLSADGLYMQIQVKSLRRNVTI